MDRRFLLAIILTALVVIGVPMLFPTPPTRPGAADSTQVITRREATGAADTPTAAATPPATTPSITARGDTAVTAAVVAIRPETTVVVTPRVTYRFSNVGAAPLSAELNDFPSLREKGRPVRLAPNGDPLLSYAIAVPGDTVPLADVPFQAERGAPENGVPTLIYRGTAEGMPVAITYTFAPDSYLVRVRGRVEDVPGRAYVLVQLPRTLRSEEADTLEDQRHLAYVFKPARDDAESVSFSKLEPGDPPRLEPGPLTWVATKSKYFVVGLLTDSTTPPFAELHLAAAPRTGKVASAAQGTVVMPVGQNGFGFELYTGPQEWRRLRALGRDFDNVNPYGGFMQGIVQPFATIVMRVLLWMKETTQLNYGWVLVIFGVAVRLLMWPLNQSAMRASMKMQELQPELQEVQRRYANNPEKQREEIMKVYQAHGMSPFSTVSGCLPMLLPMPVLFALFFVFQNTIEFRGVPFLWLPDLSMKDPTYLIVVLMGITTFLVSWVGMRGMPPNPQAKVVSYVMPLALTVFLVNMASGLNLYYTVQNLAALPQQWLIARERMRAAKAREARSPTPSRPAEPPATKAPRKKA